MEMNLSSTNSTNSDTINQIRKMFEESEEITAIKNENKNMKDVIAKYIIGAVQNKNTKNVPTTNDHSYRTWIYIG